jgi:hypothetical protein
VNVCPAIVSVPLRELALVFAVTYHVTVPLPVPLRGVQVSQLGALLVTIHRQPTPAVTETVPLADPAPGLAPVAEREKLPEPPAWVTVKVCPAIVSVPTRELQLVLAETLQVTEPLPTPPVGVQFNQLGVLLHAVQLHPLPAVTLTEPLPEPAPGYALDADNA